MNHNHASLTDIFFLSLYTIWLISILSSTFLNPSFQWSNLLSLPTWLPITLHLLTYRLLRLFTRNQIPALFPLFKRVIFSLNAVVNRDVADHESRPSKIYNLDHGRLNITLPPPTMWMNMGYWEVRSPSYHP
jgi:hypothetical protein